MHHDLAAAARWRGHGRRRRVRPWRRGHRSAAAVDRRAIASYRRCVATYKRRGRVHAAAQRCWGSGPGRPAARGIALEAEVEGGGGGGDHPAFAAVVQLGGTR
eukprot:222575-Chlamydomonas_euryale.AAC.7